MIEYKGRVAVVSGGGDGIGRALVGELARRGCDVAVLDIDRDAAERVAEKAAALGVRTTAARCDVSVLAEVEEAKSAVCDTLGAPSIIWANAGVGSMGGILTMEQRNLDWLYDVNVKGMLNVLRNFAGNLGELPGGGAIGLTASVSGFTPLGAYAAAYGATKHAVVGIGEALRAELAETAIGVTILCPGLINTRIWDAGRARPDRFGGETRMPNALGARWRDHGMSADWVAHEAVDAMAQGGGYVSPVDPHSQGDYAAHAERIMASFRFPGSTGPH
jgi:NAD(P)-dependent dehydrogenase (short-subunit alcohol dehydrogenase family)